MKSMSVCVVLEVKSVDVEVEVEAVGGTSEVASEFKVGRLCGVVSVLAIEDNELVVVPIVCMICTDLVGRFSISSLTIGGKSPSRTDWKDMYTRSR
jgi:hypothetical protein